MSPVTLAAIYAARRRLQGRLSPSSQRPSEWLSAATGAAVQLKLESLQPTHSFKIRGALHAALRLASAQPGASIVTASAGNHGKALALAAETLGLPAVVFTPATAPDTKKAAIVRHGAVLRDDSPDYDAAERSARQFAAETGAAYISPYNHPDVIAGAGTVALEVLEASPDLDVIVVPLGGGGLLSGVALAMKRAAPHVRVVGVEVEASRAFGEGLAAGRIATVAVRDSLADGLTGNLEPGSITFDLVRAHTDAIVAVSEAALARALRGLAWQEHLIVEGAGAAATAATLAAGVVSPGDRAVVLVTGANIDRQVLQRVLAQEEA